MKTKLLSLILIILMLGGLVTLTGCGSEKTSYKPTFSNAKKL